ncbi:MAG TPA: cytosine deaminase, partial [Polyangiaceae bacterium]|nr:cytosine deaminase [Polyangiaceae bacterium]
MSLHGIQRARLMGREGLWDLQFRDGRIAAIVPRASAAADGSDVAPNPSSQQLDARGRLVCPPFVEPHVHLDAVLTAGQPAFNRSGTLFEGIQRWSERKATLDHEDVKGRARKALQWQLAQGIQFVRTHCDVTDPKLVALRALLELKQEFADRLSLQIVAFPQEGIVSFPGGQALMEEAMRLGADVVGAIPHFEFTRDDGVASLKIAFDLAERFDRLLDIHCDEIDDEQSRFLEVVAAQAQHRGLGARTTASHTTAMGSYNDAYAYKLFRVLGLSGMNFIANPLVNIHLQGRFDTYPKRRGVTRVKELLQAGLNVCFGHDDIVDPWYPLGTGNMLQVL